MVKLLFVVSDDPESANVIWVAASVSQSNSCFPKPGHKYFECQDTSSLFFGWVSVASSVGQTVHSARGFTAGVVDSGQCGCDLVDSEADWG